MQRSVCLMWVLLCCISGTAFGYSGGSGDLNDPYQIATAQDLIDLGTDPNDYDKHFVLTADIDLAGFVFDQAVIAPRAEWRTLRGRGSVGWGTVSGDFFSGSFHGQGYVIHNLHIAGDGPLGLFGYTDANAVIVSVGLENVDVNGVGRYIASLVGYNRGTITSSYSLGMVTGGDWAVVVGGLVGKNDGGVITSSYSTCEVNVERQPGALGDIGIGGLVGTNFGVITSSYNTGTVIGDEHVGGLVGTNSGVITSSNSTGKIIGKGHIGGLVGVNDYGTISLSFSTGEVRSERQVYSLEYEGVGGLVGTNSGAISSSHGTGTVIGNRLVGGLVGFNGDHSSHEENVGTITSCYSTGAVMVENPFQNFPSPEFGQIGGLVGGNDGIINSSYSTGAVSGPDYVGGLVGVNSGPITSSYTLGAVSAREIVGGLVGSNGGPIKSSYSVGAVSGFYDVGGLVGINFRATTSCFWDTETSGLSYSAGGVGLTTTEMMDPEILGLNGLAEDPNWMLVAHQDYPRLLWQGTGGSPIPAPDIDWMLGTGNMEDPYQIDTVDQLLRLGKAGGLMDQCFVLNQDLDLKGIILPLAVIPDFNGHFDGQDYVIYSLCIMGDGYLGLFGRTGNGAVIKSLGLESVDVNGVGAYTGSLVGLNRGTITSSYSMGTVTGDRTVGGLAGRNSGTITSSYSMGTVTGDKIGGGLVGYNRSGDITSSYSKVAVTGWTAGGLVGSNSRFSEITSSYSTGGVSGEYRVGGLVGWNTYYSTISSSYSMGPVSGDDYVGGLVGKDDATITSSFWDIDTSGLDTSSGGIGLHTLEMYNINTYLNAGWDFINESDNGTDDIWYMPENDYPHLSWELLE